MRDLILSVLNALGLQRISSNGSGVASPEIWGGKMFDFRRITLFRLEKRFSMHKITIFSKNFGGHGPFGRPLATPMSNGITIDLMDS